MILLNMLIHVTLLTKIQVTLLYRTNEGSFFGMSSYMIKEIVPLSKHFLALIDITNKNLGPSVSFRIKIFNKSIFS